MSIDYVGTIILEIDGKDYDVESLDDTAKTGLKRVKTMNRTGKPKGSAKGVPEYDLKITVPVPPTGEPDWWNMRNAKLSIDPLEAGAKRVSFTGCGVTDVSSKYVVDGEAKRDISLFALDRKEE